MNRRRFLQASLATALPRPAFARNAASFSFVVLGDLHFDRPEHHDFAWLNANKAGDLGQIENYCKLTKEVMPKVFAAVKTKIAEFSKTDAPAAFVLQVGDLVEGLCGSAELAARQNREAVEFVKTAQLGVPFVFTKGNHDVTGNGAVEAFDEVLLPFVSAEARRVDPTIDGQHGASHSLTHGNTQFSFFDAYDRDSLDWFEACVARRTADHLFVTVHPPVVPYGARATWHLFADEKSKAKRQKLLDLLGGHEAIVLGGHLHKFCHLTRVAGGKRFTQLAVSSVISNADTKPKDELSGADAYTGDQVKLEPKHSPETEAARREIYDAERKFVPEFEYADTAGFAVVKVAGAKISAQIFNGAGSAAWREVSLA